MVWSCPGNTTEMLINPFTNRVRTSCGAKSNMATAVPSARVELAVLVACSFVDVVAFRKVGLAKGRRPVLESPNYVQCREQGLRRNDVGQPLP